MDIMQAIEHRRSVRKYSNAPIDPAAVERLERIIAQKAGFVSSFA